MCMKPWVQSPALLTLGVVVRASNPRAEEVEAGASQVQSHLELHRKLMISLGYTKHCLKKKKCYGAGEVARWFRVYTDLTEVTHSYL